MEKSKLIRDLHSDESEHLLPQEWQDHLRKPLIEHIMDSIHTRDLFEPQTLNENLYLAETSMPPPIQFDFTAYYYSIGRDLLRFNFERNLSKGPQ